MPSTCAGITPIEPSHTSVASLGLRFSLKPCIDPWAQSLINNKWKVAHKGPRSLTSWVGPVKCLFYTIYQSFSIALSPVTHSGCWPDSTPFAGCLPFPVPFPLKLSSVLCTSQLKHTPNPCLRVSPWGTQLRKYHI